ncbi:MAG TPA: tetratricopeptide repeat protein [Thermoguttaceae bacterium]|nr:tetratricopeptide repeat protein [Thermoguttaceae bacterium]
MTAPDREPFEKLAGLCWRMAVGSAILAFLMIPAAMVLRFAGLPEGLAVLGGEVVIGASLLWLRLRAYKLSLAEFLTTRGRAGRHTPPLFLMLVGAVFCAPGLYVLLTASEPADRRAHEMTVVEKRWFGVTFLLAGAGVSGLGLSGWLARHSLHRRIAQLTDEITRRPEQAELHFHRGMRLTETGQFRRAIEDFSEVIRLEPKKVKGYRERAGAYYDLNDYERVIADLTSAIGLDPENADLYLERASAYANLDDHEKAEADFNRAEELGLK